MAKPKRKPATEELSVTPIAAIAETYQELAHAIVTKYTDERTASGLVRYAIHGHPAQGPRAHLLSDPDLLTSYLSAIDAGLSPEQSALAKGLAVSTVNAHIDRGQDDIKHGQDSARALFAVAAQMARERRRMRLLGIIELASQSGPQHWTAAAWLLERGYGQDYKLQQVSGTGGVVVNVGVFTRADVVIDAAPMAIDADKP